MIRGLGTLINAAAIIASGVLGVTFRKFIKESYQETMLKATGFAVMFMGAAGSLSKLIVIEEGGKSLGTTGTLRHKSGNDSDNQFINGFVTASLTVGIGAMGIMGSINDGIYGDYAILAAKATIDFVIILVMASSMGKGCAFSSITVLVTQGSITALAAAFGGMLTDAMLTNIAMTGGILIFCIGINLALI